VSDERLSELARLGSATVYEAGGRRGYVDVDLHQIVPGSRAAGPARTVLCGQDDNLMVHAVMERIVPGEVLVLAMPQPRAVALIGDLLATQAQVAGEIDVPVTVGGAVINPGDIVVLDADGVAVVEAARVDEVLAASLLREEKERVKRAKLQAGERSYDLDGLRAVVEGG